MIHNKHKGFSIIELMIGVVISLLLVAAAATIWVSSKTSYGVQSDLSEIQEIGRFAATMLQREIRETGYLGCVGYYAKDDEDTFIEKSPTLDDVPDMVRIEGQEGADSASDSFTLWGLNTNGLGVVDDDDDDADNIININTTTLTLERPPKFKEGQIFGIADCAGGIFYEVDADMDNDAVIVELANTPDTALPRQLIGLDPTVSAADIAAGQNAYKTHLFRFHDNTYSVVNNALIRTPSVGPAEEILPDVENMQVLYGLDTDSDRRPDSYVTANNISGSQWDSVISLKIALLIRSADNRGSEIGAASYTLLNETINVPSDKRRRKVVATEVNIRNAL